MQNKYLKFLLIVFIVAFIIPQIALASWWNPFSWHIWGNIWNSVFHKQIPGVQQTVQNNKDLSNNMSAKEEANNKPESKKNIEIDLQAVEQERQDCNKNGGSFCYLQLALMTGKKEMCKAINTADLTKGDYKNFCLAVLQKNITKCQLTDGTSGIKYFSTLCSAIVNKDKNICNNDGIKNLAVYDQNGKVKTLTAQDQELNIDTCIGFVIHYNNFADNNFFDPIKYCEGNEYKHRSFSGMYLYENKQQCYQESIDMITKFGKLSSYGGNICSILENSGDSSGRRDACYYKVALRKKDVSICNSISDSKTKSLCVGIIAVPAKGESPAEGLGKQTMEKTADWKTYNNTEIGLSFKYPKDWKIDQKNNSLTILSPNIINPSGVLGKNDMRIGISGINAVPSKYSNDVNEWATGFIQLESLIYGTEILKKEEFILDDEKALRVLYKPKDTTVPDGNYYTSFLGEIYVILGNGKGYTMNYDPYDSNLIESFDGILSTFKFKK